VRVAWRPDAQHLFESASGARVAEALPAAAAVDVRQAGA
jgi:hypothetical protein